MKIKKATIIKIAVLIAVVLSFIFIKPLNTWLKNAVAAFQDIESVKAYIQSFGVWAVAASFLLMILQSLAAPIPAFFVTFANAMIWGWKWGALISWSSAMVGAMLCFYISRMYGRTVTEKFVSASALKSVDTFFVKYGKNAILTARLLPFVPFDPISYAAGLTGMSFFDFALATGIGQLPATIVYSYAAEKASNPSTFVKGLLLMFGIAALIYFIKIIWSEKNKKQKTVQEDCDMQ